MFGSQVCGIENHFDGPYAVRFGAGLVGLTRVYDRGPFRPTRGSHVASGARQSNRCVWNRRPFRLTRGSQVASALVRLACVWKQSPFRLARCGQDASWARQADRCVWDRSPFRLIRGGQVGSGARQADRCEELGSKPIPIDQRPPGWELGSSG